VNRTPSFESLIARIRGEYREMPGLHLTLAQACRLWQVDATTCETVLEQLVREAFLHRTDHGAYIGLSTTAHHPAKAHLRERVPLPRSARTAIAGSRALSWLYTRGAQSVRLVREENAEGCHVVVHGPATEIAIHGFSNVREGVKRQAEIERSLQAAGFQLDTISSERRSADGIWGGRDHRRAAS